MKSLLTLASLALAASFAHAAEGVTVETLRTECAAKYSAKLDTKDDGAANSYHFVYAKGEYKGELQSGKALPCTEGQYVAYLDTQDPTRVMSAYPTAAGRPTAAKK
ncbi:hypothetical protein SNE35_06850 [Paucibacter sp. R3-3]|uniref:Uncharacterized protein n=1 Tax=Roseateles agri TaxID=3098619 RepID=A0ABU5DD52_9BURK|nr:hypothetical protein [Paucibacter sp. R3-3]MDY0744216.1 hypothetical protein [Paucibacter sp. R3-3]